MRASVCSLLQCDLFFFQAEDGIRDDLVTGVQTCALPISSGCQRTAGRGVSPNPGQSIATVVNATARRSCSGRISPRVEIELRAGSIRMVGPAPMRVTPRRTGAPCQLQSIWSRWICMGSGRGCSPDGAQRNPGTAFDCGDDRPGLRLVYHRAGPTGPAFGRPDGRLRPDAVAPSGLQARDPYFSSRDCKNRANAFSVTSET